MNSLPPTKYHHKTKIGNWYEEQELEETRFPSHQHSASNTLKSILLD